MFCKKCGGELDPITKTCDSCGGASSGMSTLDFLSTFYRKIFVVVFWICLAGCMIGVSYGFYSTMKYATDNTVLVFLLTVVGVVVCEALIILGFGTVAVFLNIQKGVEDLNEKTDKLGADVKKIGNFLVQIYRDKSVTSTNIDNPNEKK